MKILDRGWFTSPNNHRSNNNNRNHQNRFPPQQQRQQHLDGWNNYSNNHLNNDHARPEAWNSSGSNSYSTNVGSTPFFMLNQLSNQQIPKTIFTVNCGEIRPKDDGTRVKISGKVVKRPRTGRFLEIKDIKGCTQLVATDDKPEIGMKFQSIPAEAFITVIGTVQLRPNNFFNKVSFIVF